MPDFSFLDKVVDSYVKAIVDIVGGPIDSGAAWEQNEYEKETYYKDIYVKSQVTRSHLDKFRIEFTTKKDGVRVSTYFSRSVKFPDINGTQKEVAAQLSQYKAMVQKILNPLIHEEQLRRDAEKQFGAATEVIRKAIENALYSKWNAKVEAYAKETLLVEGKPFQKVSYVIKGVLPRIKEQATREFSDPAIKAVREILSKMIPKLKVGNVRMKLSSTPSSWSDYNITGDVILYMDGTKPPRMARGDLIRMAYAHPDKRAALLPLIKKAAPEVRVTLKKDLKLKNGVVVPKGTTGSVMFGLHGGHHQYPEGASVRLEGLQPLLLKVVNFYDYFGHPFTPTPTAGELQEMATTGEAMTPLGETVAPDGYDKYQAASWLRILGSV